MLQVTLEGSRDSGYRNARLLAIPVVKAAPFCWSPAGKYVHRIRSATIYCWDGEDSHMAVKLWCGSVMNSPAISDDPPSKRPICATCEGRAIGAGQLGAPVIAGRVVMYSPRR